MPAKLGPWGVIIGIIAIVLIVLSLLFFTRQVQQAPVPTPTGPVPVVTAEITPETTSSADDLEVNATQDADDDALPTAAVEATAES
jgi:hypothetical protein